MEDLMDHVGETLGAHLLVILKHVESYFIKVGFG